MPSHTIAIKASPLTAEAFASFGTVITSPLPPSINEIPRIPPANAAHANQKTALRYGHVSPIDSIYQISPSGIPAKPTTSLFSCFPRPLRSCQSGSIFDVRILERHPFTTQSFVPFSTSSSKNSYALIIVAPTLDAAQSPSDLTPYFPQYNGRQGGMPDLQNIKAFITEQPGVGVTYGVGTWHAPMVVLGDARVDFIVTQWMNGREGEDCQEVVIPAGVEVILDTQESATREKAKL